MSESHKALHLLRPDRIHACLKFNIVAGYRRSRQLQAEPPTAGVRRSRPPQACSGRACQANSCCICAAREIGSRTEDAWQTRPESKAAESAWRHACVVQSRCDARTWSPQGAGLEMPMRTHCRRRMPVSHQANTKRPTGSRSVAHMGGGSGWPKLPGGPGWRLAERPNSGWLASALQHYRPDHTLLRLPGICI